MDWFFLGLVILGSIWGWAKNFNKVPGQYIIQEVTKERFGRTLISAAGAVYSGIGI